MCGVTTHAAECTHQCLRASRKQISCQILQLNKLLGCAGAVYKYDLSLPPDDMYKLVEETRARMKHLPVTVVGYGHMGDSNLHLNISAGDCCASAM